jgi:O-antigen/teichoic acid export membrane protein
MTADEVTAVAADDGGETLRRVARGGSFAAVGTSGAAVLGFVLTLVVTHELSTNSAGIFFSATAAYIVVQTLLSFGVGAGVVRFIPRLRSLGRSDDVPALLAVAYVPVVAFGLIGTLGMWFAAPSLAHALSHGDPAGATTALHVLALMILPGVLQTALVESTRGFGSIRSYVLVQQMFLPLARPILVYAAVEAGAPFWVIVLGWALPLLVAMVMAGRVLIKAMVAAYGRPFPWPQRTKSLRALAGEYWSFTGARGVASVMEILLTWLDVLIVAAIVSPTQAAIYAAASRFITSGTLILQALRLALAPELSAALARHHTQRVSEIYQAATQWVILTSWPLYLAMAVFAPRLLLVFGPTYADGATALSILCVAMLVNLAAGNVGTVLLMGGKSSWVLADKAAALSLNVALDIILTPHFGISGAAVAWAVTILLDSGLAIGQVRWGMGIGGSPNTMFLCGALAVLCFGLIPLAGRLALGTSLTAAFGSVAVALVIYAPLIWRVRERVQLSLLMQSLRPGGSRSKYEGARRAA